VIILIISVVTVFLEIFYSGEIKLKSVLESILFNTYYGVPLSLVNGYFFDWLSEVVPWEKTPRKRAYLGVIGSIALTMGTVIILNLFLWVYYWDNPISVLWSKDNHSFYMIALVITIIASTTIHAISFFKEVQNERRVSQRLREEKLATELSALRSHVDPHFLFNSFNVLSGLIDEDPERAQDFLAGLSKIYRYILEQRNNDTSTVRDELAFSEKYLDLQQTRFEHSINVETRISEEGMGRLLPSLSLQLLLENAIKHNGFSVQNPLNILIAEEEDALVVSNSIQPRKSLTDSSGMGLQNIRDRYALLTKKEIEVNTNDHFFTVKLPLI